MAVIYAKYQNFDLLEVHNKPLHHSIYFEMHIKPLSNGGHFTFQHQPHEGKQKVGPTFILFFKLGSFTFKDFYIGISHNLS